jgi:hypothetical protein
VIFPVGQKPLPPSMLQERPSSCLLKQFSPFLNEKETQEMLENLKYDIAKQINAHLKKIKEHYKKLKTAHAS